MPINGMIMVTRNIAEAVPMCDRNLVLGSNPGRILNQIEVDLPLPFAARPRLPRFGGTSMSR